jgi:hypothetical protein
MFWICLPCMRENIRPLCFWSWLTSFNMTSSMKVSIYLQTTCHYSLWLSRTPLCVCIYIYISHIFLIHSFIVGHQNTQTLLMTREKSFVALVNSQKIWSKSQYWIDLVETALMILPLSNNCLPGGAQPYHTTPPLSWPMWHTLTASVRGKGSPWFSSNF